MNFKLDIQSIQQGRNIPAVQMGMVKFLGFALYFLTKKWTAPYNYQVKFMISQ